MRQLAPFLRQIGLAIGICALVALASDLDSASPTLTVPTHELATGVYRFTASAARDQAGVAFTVVR